MSVEMTRLVVKLGTFMLVVSGQTRAKAKPKAATRAMNATPISLTLRSAPPSSMKDKDTVTVWVVVGCECMACEGEQRRGNGTGTHCNP